MNSNGAAKAAASDAEAESLKLQAHLEDKPESFVQLADVVLEVDGVKFLAHSTLLAAQSSVLNDLLVEVAGNTRKDSVADRPMLVVGAGFADGGDGDAGGGAAPSTISVDAFGAFLRLIYTPFIDLDAELATLVVPAAHFLQADGMLQACDAAVAKSLDMSWRNPAPYVPQDHGLGRDTDALDLAIRYDLRRTAARVLGSVMGKLMGQGGRQGDQVAKERALQYASTLPVQWQQAVMRELLLYTHGPVYSSRVYVEEYAGSDEVAHVETLLLEVMGHSR